MKRFKDTKILFVLLALVILTGCDKFGLLKDQDMDKINAGAYTSELTFAAFIRSDNYQENDRYSQLKLYAQAIKKANIEELLDDVSRQFTIVAFTDVAMRSFISTNGYADIDEVPSEVLKHFILNNIIENRYDVVDLEVNKELGFLSLTSDSIFLKRESTRANPYILKVNSVGRYASANVTIRSVNLLFKNAIAHVSNAVTFTEVSKLAQDERPTNLPTLKDTLYVTKDAVLLYAANVSGYSVSNGTGPDAFQTKTASITTTRRLFLQFPIRSASFSERVGVATLNMFHIRTANAGALTQSQISVYQDAKTDWNENSTSFSNLPVMGAQISSFEIPSASDVRDTWFGAGVSSAVINAIDNGDSFINIGVFNMSNSNVYFGHKEYTGNTNKKAFIVLESTPEAILTSATVNPLVLGSSDFYKVITKQNLNIVGAADKNINYIITQQPLKGTVICNGRPLNAGGSFSQHQLVQGVVKYLPNIDAISGSDEIKLEVQDYRGGFYPSIITLPIQIN